MPSRLTRARLIAALLILAAVAGCDDDADLIPITQFDWDTSGGGDLHFTVVPAEGPDPGYWIDVTQRVFRPADHRIALTPEHGDVHALVSDVFERRLDIHDHTFTPKGPTGTWTSIVQWFESGESEIIRNVRVQSALGKLYSLVYDAVE